MLNLAFRLYIAAGIAAIAVLVLAFPSTEKKFDPLRNQTQTVLTKMPLVATDGLGVMVEGTKCSVSDESILVRSTIVWQSLIPRGTVIQVGEGVREQTPGCTTIKYDNPVPTSVLSRTRTLLANGYDRVVWILTGVETPEHPNAVPRAWRTQPITFVNPKEE